MTERNDDLMYTTLQQFITENSDDEREHLQNLALFDYALPTLEEARTLVKPSDIVRVGCCFMMKRQ